MAYNAYETTKALERPSVTVDRVDTHLFRFMGRIAVWVRRQLNRLPGVDLEAETRTYTGRLLSQAEFQAFQPKIERLDEDDMKPAEVTAFLRDYLLAIHIPPSVVLEMPPRLMGEAVRDFFACQIRASLAGDRIETEMEVPRVTSPPGASTRSGSRARQRT